LEQLALHSAVPPARVLRRHPHEQRRDGMGDRRAAGSVRVGPSLTHESAVPAQDGARGDQAMGAQPRGQPSDEGGEGRPGPPSPGGASGWCAAARRPRAAGRAVRRPWWRTCGRRAGVVRACVERSGRATAATQGRSCTASARRRSLLLSRDARHSGTPQGAPMSFRHLRRCRRARPDTGTGHHQVPPVTA
jgi:hypothetical protein